ncbi:hypothetical protein SDC9_175372 [bioreactor metagenome]|uniref:Uncharacterized protein n=1 Tax=bioreactor metagenome TaxID=1076179 RepID=A0A645GLZ2_9ZZZZ
MKDTAEAPGLSPRFPVSFRKVQPHFGGCFEEGFGHAFESFALWLHPPQEGFYHLLGDLVGREYRAIIIGGCGEIGCEPGCIAGFEQLQNGICQGSELVWRGLIQRRRITRSGENITRGGNQAQPGNNKRT